MGLFISFALVACALLGVTVYGQTNKNVYVATNEAFIDAVANAKEDETIILQEDIEIDENLDITTTVTLDLNGKTLKNSSNESSDALISIKENAALTITGDGVIEATENERNAIDISGGSLTIDGGTVIGNESAVFVNEGQVKINGGVFKNAQISRSIHYQLDGVEENFANGTASIVVTGGSFQQFDPAGSYTDNPHRNFVAEGYKSVYNQETGFYDVVAIVNVEVSTAAELLDKIAHTKENEIIVLKNDIETQENININKTITLNMNGKTLKATQDLWNSANREWSVISVQAGGNLTITGNGTIEASDGESDECYALDVRDGGKLTIENGTFIGNCSALYVHTGEATILDGVFNIHDNNEAYDYAYLLNCRDASLKDGTAKIFVKGGSFYKLNPANSRSENPLYNFVPTGYTSVYDDNTEFYHVSKLA